MAMTDEEVLEALHANYIVDIEKGDVISKKTGKPLFRYYARRKGWKTADESDVRSKYPRVYIKNKGKGSGRSVCKLIWMYSRDSVVPPGCDIHHWDVDHTNNNWQNLVCIHAKDHNLFHSLLESNADFETA